MFRINNSQSYSIFLLRYPLAVLATAIVYFSPKLVSAQEELQWKHFGDLHYGYHRFGAIPISPTKILITAGFTQMAAIRGDEGKVVRTCEIIDVHARRVYMASSMNTGHAHGALVQTPDSNVIILGGMDTNKQVTTICELYDRRTGQWQIIGNLITARWIHSALLINSEEILVVGGRSHRAVINDAEIFNIRTKKSRPIAPFPCLSEVTTVFFSQLAAPGKILAAPGRSLGRESFHNAIIYEYDRVQDIWKPLFQGVTTGNGIHLSEQQFVFLSMPWTYQPEKPIMLIEKESGFYSTKNTMFFECRIGGNLIKWGNSIGLAISGSRAVLPGGELQVNSEWFDTESESVVRAPSLLYPRINIQAIFLQEQTSEGSIRKKSILAIGGVDANNVISQKIEILETTDQNLLQIPSPEISRRRLQSIFFSPIVVGILYFFVIGLIGILIYTLQKILSVRRQLRKQSISIVSTMDHTHNTHKVKKV